MIETDKIVTEGLQKKIEYLGPLFDSAKQFHRSVFGNKANAKPSEVPIPTVSCIPKIKEEIEPYYISLTAKFHAIQRGQTERYIPLMIAMYALSRSARELNKRINGDLIFRHDITENRVEKEIENYRIFNGDHFPNNETCSLEFKSLFEKAQGEVEYYHTTEELMLAIYAGNMASLFSELERVQTSMEFTFAKLDRYHSLAYTKTPAGTKSELREDSRMILRAIKHNNGVYDECCKLYGKFTMK